MIDTAEIRLYPGCPACWSRIIELCDEVDRLRGKIAAAREYAFDEENQDEMSSDAQEWVTEVVGFLDDRH
jgi:hypothetical protein